MNQGFDCATPLSLDLAKRFKTGGHEFVGRYLVPSGWKALTAAEAKAISAAGLQIVSVFETTEDRALGGRTSGINDGYTAAKVARDVGQPQGSCIYGAVDFDPTDAQMPKVIEYIRGFSEATPNYTTGVYGSHAVVQAVRAAGVCSRFWQTYAWSRGKKADGIHIYQYKNDIMENGIGVDLNEGYEGLGYWNTLKVEDDELMLNIEDADLAIGLFQEAYKMGVTKITKPDGEVVTVNQDKIHDLANAQRRASGQPEE